MRTVSIMAAMAVSSLLSAQAPMPPRPRLSGDADTNDAQSYFAHGRAARTWSATVDAYLWAWRLDPAETDYLYALYNASYNRQSYQWRVAYERGDEKTTESKEAKHIDSLWTELLRRDPFPFIEGPCVLLPGIEQERDPLIAGIVYSWSHCPERAAQKLGEALQKDPTLSRIRFIRALNLYFHRQFTASGQEVQVLLDTLRARDETTLGSSYFTKELFEHMLAVTRLRARDTAQAHAALTRALTENLGYYPARLALAQIAMNRRDVPTALKEAEQAIELRGDNGYLRYEYATLLRRAGKMPEAAAEFTRVIELEPYWADARRQLALVLDQQNRREEAIAAYQAFLDRAPRRENIRIKEAQDRIAALKAAGGS